MGDTISELRADLERLEWALKRESVAWRKAAAQGNGGHSIRGWNSLSELVDAIADIEKALALRCHDAD